MAVDIFKGPVKPEKHSRTGMRHKLPRKEKQRRKRKRVGEKWRKRTTERDSRVGFLRRENPEPQKIHHLYPRVLGRNILSLHWDLWMGEASR